MERMSCIVVLCVILLVSQVEMLPVTQGLSNGSPATLTQGLSHGSPATLALNRVRRAVIGNSECPDEKIKLKMGGMVSCVTCDEYMDRKDVDDCPTNR